MIIQLILSPISFQNLCHIGNPSQTIEWIVRRHIHSFPTPYMVKNIYGRQSLIVNLTPYTIRTLKGFTGFGMNPSQVVEWLLVSYINSLKAIEQTKEQTEPKVKQSKVKPSKTKKEQTYSKPAYVRTQTNGPVTKKVKKIKPMR